MNVKPLWKLSHPGLSNELVHFTGRVGKATDHLNAEIASMTARDKLVAVLQQRRLLANRPFWSLGDPVVCFTEATPEALEALVKMPGYEPWGVGFSKEYIFRSGGGPAFYVRADEWSSVGQSALPPQIKAFATPFWPGATPTPGEPDLPSHLAKTSQWFHEREWRVPRTDVAPSLNFDFAQLRLLVVPSAEEQTALVEECPALADHLAHIEVLQIPYPIELPHENETAEAPAFDPWDWENPNNPYAELVKEILDIE